jgi:hypothetical protein
MIFEINRVNATQKEDGSWAWGSSQIIGVFRTNSYDVRRAIKRTLAGMGITFGRTHTRLTCDGDRYVVRVMTTGEPLYIAVRVATAPQAMKSSTGRSTR